MTCEYEWALDTLSMPNYRHGSPIFIIMMDRLSMVQMPQDNLMHNRAIHKQTDTHSEYNHLYVLLEVLKRNKLKKRKQNHTTRIWCGSLKCIDSDTHTCARALSLSLSASSSSSPLSIVSVLRRRFYDCRYTIVCCRPYHLFFSHFFSCLYTHRLPDSAFLSASCAHFSFSHTLTVRLVHLLRTSRVYKHTCTHTYITHKCVFVLCSDILVAAFFVCTNVKWFIKLLDGQLRQLVGLFNQSV